MSRIALLAALSCAALLARADVFLLADGSRVEGISTENGDQVTITTYDGKTVNVAKKDIRGTISEPKRNEYFARLKKLKDNDAAGRVELAQFCLKNNLKKEAQALCEAALKIEPANEAAGKALGYEFANGKWQPAVDNNIQIGVRPPPKVVEPPPPKDQVEALIRVLEKTPVDAGNPPPSPDIPAIVAKARENPGPLIKLLIPPQWPNAQPRSKTEVRTRAAWLAGLTQDRRLMQPLVDASIYDPEESVRFAAAKALPMLEEPVALRKLTDIAFSSDNQHFPWPVRKIAAQALRRYGSQEVIERMMKSLSFELAGGNPRDPKNHLRGKGTGLASDNPVGIWDNDKYAYGAPDTDLYPVMSAAKEITGQSFDKKDKDMKTWFDWWAKDGQNFVFKD
ncbi:MAG TPA: HEAT repeat domain-containing protein [Planctomycetota bacterium]|nr:HEAT repeat domain-containing protein [Planctomycetota bacterium]